MTSEAMLGYLVKIRKLASNIYRLGIILEIRASMCGELERITLEAAFWC